MEFTETPTNKATTMKMTKPKGHPTMSNKEKYQTAIDAHNADIKKLRADIKKHKLLKKQAKTVYELSKLA